MVGLGGIQEVSISCWSRAACYRSCEKSQIDLGSDASSAVNEIFPGLVVQRDRRGLRGWIVGVCISPVTSSAPCLTIIIELNPENIECRRLDHVTHVRIFESVLG